MSFKVIFSGFITGFADSIVGTLNGLKMILSNRHMIKAKADKHEGWSRNKISNSSISHGESIYKRHNKSLNLGMEQHEFTNTCIITDSALSLAKCVAANLFVAVIFVWILLPVLYFISSMFASSNDEHFSPTVFGILYFHLPPVIAIRFLCALWFSDIASDLISRAGFQPTRSCTARYKIADVIVAFIVEALFFIQSSLVSLVFPSFLGSIAAMFHFSLLHALYSFEYLWMFQGYLIQHRLSMIEQNWPYFLGFGMPLTVITMISNNFVVNAAIFGIFYPLFISSSCMVNFESRFTRKIKSFPIFFASFWLTNKFISFLMKIFECLRSKSRTTPTV